MPIDVQTFAARAAGGGWKLGVPAWPNWAKFALFVPMVPGILLLALSLLLLFVSLAALFVLTAPVYTLLNRVLSERKSEDPVRSPGSKRVEAVVRDV
jgi:hypothetical protein